LFLSFYVPKNGDYRRRTMSRSFAMMDYGLWIERFTIVNYVSKSFSASNDRMIAKCLDLGVVHEIIKAFVVL